MDSTEKIRYLLTIAKRKIEIKKSDDNYLQVKDSATLNLKLNKNLELIYSKNSSDEEEAAVYVIDSNEKICSVKSSDLDGYLCVNEDSFSECGSRKNNIYELFEKAYQEKEDKQNELIRNEFKDNDYLVYDSTNLNNIMQSIKIEQIKDMVKSILSIYKTLDKNSRLFKRMTSYYLPEIEIMMENMVNCINEMLNEIDPTKNKNNSKEEQLLEIINLYYKTIFVFEECLENKKAEEDFKNEDEAEIICDTFNSILSLDGLTTESGFGVWTIND